jgi:TolA-binding protein
MRVKTLLTFTALMSTILGAAVAYFVLTVPNDLKASELMKKARVDLAAGKNDTARDSLSKIVQQYPRTDAAAAATVALVKIAQSEREQLQRELVVMRRENQRQSQLLAELQRSVAEIKRAPKPAPVVVPAPAKPKPLVVKKAPVKKPPVKKKAPRRR